MKLLDVMTAPWAIVPTKLIEMREVYLTHTRGEKIDLKKIRAQERPVEPEAYHNASGVAIIPVEDVLTKSRSFFSFIFGGTSMRDIGDAVMQAMNDPSVHSIILHVDSPGGTVDGTETLVNLISSYRGQKPIVAYGDGLVASAAYWVSAAADKIIIAGETTEVGSIGVVATHVDLSKQDEMFGEKYTEITAGSYKRIASMHKPLSDEGKAYIQGQVDHIYQVFVDSIASLRGRSVEQVLEAADGKIFIGKAAVDAGLVDGIASLDELINKLKEESQMNVKDLKEKHNDIYVAVLEEGRVAGHAKGLEEGKEEGILIGRVEGAVAGAEGERKRIKDIEDATVSGYESIVTGMKFDGTKTVADVKDAILEAVRKVNKDELKKLTDDAIKPAPHAAPPSEEDASYSHLPVEQRAKATWDKNPDLRKEFGDNFEPYLAYLTQIEAGNVRVFKRKAE
jgi:signal peptide peptidase SppA